MACSSSIGMKFKISEWKIFNSRTSFSFKFRNYDFNNVFATGLCYGKLEVGILTFIIPTVLLGHLVWFTKFSSSSYYLIILISQLHYFTVVQSGLMDEGTKLTLLGVWMALFVIFAGRKFTQPIKKVAWIYHL